MDEASQQPRLGVSRTLGKARAQPRGPGAIRKNGRRDAGEDGDEAMSELIEVKQNPDGSWTASGGSSLLVIRVTCTTEHKAIVNLNVALAAIRAQAKS